MVGFVEWDDRKAVKALQRLQQNVGDISPALREIGDMLTESTKQRFVTKTGPSGQKWDDNTDVTMWTPKKLPGGGYSIKGRNDPLVDHGTLMDTIHPQLVGNNILEVGTAMEHAAMQQFGGSKEEFPFLWGDIPERPFFGISNEDEEAILGTIEDYLIDGI